MESNEIYIAYNVELGRIFKVGYGLPKNPQNYTWTCRNCKKPVFYNPYEKCFKHRGKKPEDFEPETLEHKTMKNYWYTVFPKFNHIKSRHKEFWLEDQVADVFFELRDGKKVAIECQNSPIIAKKLIERTKKYTKKNIYVLWVFNGSGSCVSEEKRPCNSDKIRVLKEERRLHNLYGGRIYYMNVIGEEVVEQPYPIHFSPYFENQRLKTSIYGHDKYYRDYQSATLGTIFSYNILCIEYNGYYLARFMDKNMGISCAEQLHMCLKEICLKKLKEEFLTENQEVEVPINSIIKLVHEEFGYFLPYSILKRSKKRIKRVRFERKLDNNYNIQDTIVIKISDFL